jgi:ATP-binding cassette subfamily C (CFTR/MRP) protein 1
MQKGTAQFITEDDLPPLKSADESVNLGNELNKSLKNQLNFFQDKFFLNSQSISTLWKALFVAYGGPYAVAAGLKIIQDVLAFLQPQLLRLLLMYISRYQVARFLPINDDQKPSILEGFSIAGIMFLASIVQTITLNQVNTASSARIYGKLTPPPSPVFSTGLRDWVSICSIIATNTYL